MEDLKQQIQQAWQNLKTQELEGTKAQALYNQTVWPLLLKLWQHEPQVYPLRETFEVSIHTLGTSPEATTLAALGLGAGEVYVLHTPESKRYLEQLQQDLGRSVYPIEIDKSNVTRLYQAVGEQVRKHPGKKIALDLTSGTKAMSAGMAAAGYFLQRVHPSLRVAYVDNDAFDAALRKPVAGTEKLILLPNPHEVLGDLDEHLAQEFYREREYGKAAQRYDELFEKTGQGGFRLYALLCRINQSVYGFNIESALENIEQLLKQLSLDTYRTHPLAAHIKNLTAQQTGLQNVARLFYSSRNQETSLGDLGDREEVAWALAVFKFMAEGRLESGRVAEAILLRYRALELFLQHRLARWGFDTAKPNFAKLCEDAQTSLEALQNHYQSERKKAGLKQEDQLAQKPAIDLITAFFLLRALGDPAALAVNANKVVGLTKARNSSVFAHGFEPPKKSLADDLAETLATLVEKGELPKAVFEPIPLA